MSAAVPAGDGVRVRAGPAAEEEAGGTGSPEHRQLATVARGGVSGLLGAVVAGVSGFALTVVVANRYAVDVAGAFFALTSVFMIGLAVCSLGAETGLARFGLRFEAHGRGGELRTLVRVALTPPVWCSVVVGGALLLAAPAVASWLALPDDGPQAVRLVGVGLPLAVLSSLCLAGTRAFARMRPTVLVDNLGRSGSQPLILLGASYLGAGLAGMTLAWSLPFALACALAAVALSRQLGRRATPSATSRGSVREVRREFWIFTWPRAITRVSQMAIQRVDIVIVAALLGPVDAAVYTAATRFVVLGQLGGQALQQVLAPRFSQLIARGERRVLREVYRVATGWNAAISWPIYLVVAAAPGAYLGLFGPEYQGARPVVWLMAAALLLSVSAGPADTVLLMAGHSTWSLGISLTALALDVVLCFLLVPEWGIGGAALAWAIAVGTRAVLGFVLAGHVLGVRSVGTPLLVVAGASVLAVAVPVIAVGALVDLGAVDLLLLAPPCAAVYAGLLWVGRGPLALDALRAGLRARSAAPSSR